MSSSQSWIVQDLTDDRSFSIEVNDDPTLIGDHTLSIEVSSVDYPNDISVYTITVPITVVSFCHDSEIKLPSPVIDPWIVEIMTSAIPTLFELPEVEDSGTKKLQLIADFESLNCGTWTYTMTSS